MKLIIFLLTILLTIANAFPGVGGSGGGRSDRSLKFYIDSRHHDPKIPQIEFATDDTSTMIPVNEVCVRDEDTFESKDVVLVKHFDENGTIIFQAMEKLSRTRNYIKTIYRNHIFRKDEVITEDAILPLSYEINVYSTQMKKNESDPRFVTKINYSLENCK